ncbi:EH domain-binding protein 1 isoform X1 [Drosophila pseudoobscura]|uniref:EH domain-binding protein 1 isoform X1 n=1 Tax=Drosophila pseudoobscura pseudoobscura TaxID=46245 RepID=A0A6I8V5T6_DROPS|nr:EH domain-binding protein 1 isoform X1 [Drosophila pseudoobscura]
MEAIKEHLCEIKKLVKYLNAASMSSQMWKQWNTTLNSPPMRCMGKIIILIRLMADQFREYFGSQSNQMADLSRILAKCTGQIKRLYLKEPWGQSEMRNRGVVDPSFIVAVSAIFSELEGVIKDYLRLAYMKAEYGKTQKSDHYNVPSDRRDNLADSAGKTPYNKLKLRESCPTIELGRVTAKLRNFEVKRELEQLDHKLMILKEHTLTRRALLVQHAAEIRFKNQQDLVLKLSSGLSEEKLKLQAALKENSRLMEIQQTCYQNLLTPPQPPQMQECHKFRLAEDSQSVQSTQTENNSHLSPDIAASAQPNKYESTNTTTRETQHGAIQCQVESDPELSKSFYQKQKAAVNESGNTSTKNSTTTGSCLCRIKKPNVVEPHPGTTFGQRRHKLLRWCQEKTKPYGIPMYEFSTSWQSGHALCAIIHSYRPNLIDTKYIKCKNRRETLEYGVMVAQSLGVRSNIDFVSLCLQKIPENIMVFQFVAELYNCLEDSANFRRSSR